MIYDVIEMFFEKCKFAYYERNTHVRDALHNAEILKAWHGGMLHHIQMNLMILF